MVGAHVMDRDSNRDQLFGPDQKSRPTEWTGQTGLRGPILLDLCRVYGRALFSRAGQTYLLNTVCRTEGTKQTGRSQSKSRHRPTKHFLPLASVTIPSNG